jgi:hypothetical protein
MGIFYEEGWFCENCGDGPQGLWRTNCPICDAHCDEPSPFSPPASPPADVYTESAVNPTNYQIVAEDTRE